MNADPSLLLVEDDESDVIFLKRALQKVGSEFPLQVAETGTRAVAMLEGSGPSRDRGTIPRPTHVLMDLKLPEKSGMEVLEWIRSTPSLKDIKVAILTSSSENRDLGRAWELGVDCYLVKPMSFSVLLDVARSISLWVTTGRIPSSSEKVGNPRA